MRAGFMVVCDGSNGAGKTTLIQALDAHFRLAGWTTVCTREPGGTPIGERLRQVVLDPTTSSMSDMTELMIFGAARAQHMHEKILPALAAGAFVICDRFDSATVAFQHYGRGISLEAIRAVNRLALGTFRPDLTLILDLDPVVGLARLAARPHAQDRLETEDMAFLERARQGYLKQAAAHPDDFVVIDAAQPFEAVLGQALRAIEASLANRRRATVAQTVGSQ